MQSASPVIRALLLVAALTLLPGRVGHSGVIRQSLCASESGVCRFEVKSNCDVDGQVHINHYED